MAMKNSNDTIGNRTRAVPPPAALRRALSCREYFKFGIGFKLFVRSNCSYIYLVVICYVRIFGNFIFNLFVLTSHDILYHKCLLCIYVLPENGLSRPKHVGEIIVTKIFMHEYVPLVGINTV